VNKFEKKKGDSRRNKGGMSNAPQRQARKQVLRQKGVKFDRKDTAKGNCRSPLLAKGKASDPIKSRKGDNFHKGRNVREKLLEIKGTKLAAQKGHLEKRS